MFRNFGVLAGFVDNLEETENEVLIFRNKKLNGMLCFPNAAWKCC